MNIAITRLEEKGDADAEICAKYGHTAKPVHPLRAEYNASLAQRFILAANEGEFDAILFLSAYPAKKIAPLLARGITKKCRIIAIGPETQRILFENGIPAEILPEYYSKAFVPYLGDWIDGKSIGIARADTPNQKLISSIEDAGGIAYEYRVYKLVPTNEPFDLTDCDAILFTSPHSFTSSVLPDITTLKKLAIGKVTAQTMRQNGIEPDIIGNGSMEGTISLLEKE